VSKFAIRVSGARKNLGFFWMDTSCVHSWKDGQMNRTEIKLLSHGFQKARMISACIEGFTKIQMFGECFVSEKWF
jgi:hypothetical protein